VVEPGEGPRSASASASVADGLVAGPAKTLLKRVDPNTDEVVEKIKVGRGDVDIAPDESSEAVWVASGYLPKTYGGDDNPKYSEDRNLTRLDPETNERLRISLLQRMVLGSSRRTLAIAPSNAQALCVFGTDVTIAQ
jgi:DNA-binding beta-propeller fold protein YncE